MTDFAQTTGPIRSAPDHARVGNTVDILNAIHEAGVNLVIWQRANPQKNIANDALKSSKLFKKGGVNFRKSKVEFNIRRDLKELTLVKDRLKDQCDLDLSYLYPKRAEMIEAFFRLFPNTDMIRYESRIHGPAAATGYGHSFHVDRDPTTVTSKSQSFMISTDIGEEATKWLPFGEYTLGVHVDAFAESEHYVAIPKNENSIRHMKPDDVALMWPGNTIHSGLYHSTPDKNPRALVLLYEPLTRQRNNPIPAPFYDWAPS